MTNTTLQNRKPLLIGAAVCAVAAVAVGVWLAKHPAKEPLYGMMQAKTVDVAAKVTGRVEALKVLVLDIPEVEAKLKEVRALQEAAAAKSSLVDEGARPQEIRAAKAQMQRAQAGAQLATKTYNRVRSLYKDGLVSKQKFDEALAQKQSADQMLAMAREQYDIAVTGARAQEKTAASALSQQAAGGVEQVQTIVDEKNVTAPLAAEVSRIFVEEGEIAAAGVALVSLVDLTDQWVVFNVREDAMPEIKKGTQLKAEIPALGRKDVAFEVYFINARGEYATWRATRQSTGFDLKTFEVRARPVSAVPDLRPGMSVIVHR